MSKDTLVEVALMGGQDTGIENTASPRPLLMRNCWYQRGNGVQKRYGTARLSNGVAAYLPPRQNSYIVPSLSSTTSVALFEENGAPVCLTDTDVRTYSSSQGGWLVQDIGPQMRFEQTVLRSTTESTKDPTQKQPTIYGYACAINSTGVLGYVWSEYSANLCEIFFGSYDTATGANIADRVLIYADTTNTTQAYARIVAMGATFHIVFTDVTNGKISYRTCNAYGSVATSGDHVTGISGATVFDMSVNPAGTRYAIAYWSYGDTSVTYKTYDITDVNLATNTLSAAAVTALTVYHGTSDIWGVVQRSGAGTLLVHATTNLVTLTSASIDATNSALAQCGIHQGSGEAYATVLWATSTGGYSAWATYDTALALLNSSSQYKSYNSWPITQPLRVAAGSVNYRCVGMQTSVNPNSSEITGMNAFCALRDGSSGSGVAAQMKPVALSYFGGRADSSSFDKIGGVSNFPLTRPVQDVDGNVYFLCAFAETSARSNISGFNPRTKMLLMKGLVTAEQQQVADIGKTTLFSGGANKSYELTGFSDSAFTDIPVFTAAAATSGSLTQGLVGVAVVYTYQDARGNIVRSAPYVLPSSVNLTGSNHSISLVINCPQISDGAWSNRQFFAEVYTTVQTGTVYYMYDTYLVPSDSATVSVSVTTDPVTTNRQLYTTGGVLDNVRPPGGSCVCAHKQRYWIGGTPDDTIWYSKGYVDGEMPGFNEGFTIQPFEGGRVVGLQSFGQNLVIFKSSSIFFLSGDPPGDTGVDGSGTSSRAAASQLSLPAYVSANVGLIDKMSAVYTPIGLLFRGQRGMYLLNESLQLSYVGKPVESILTEGYTITDAFLVERDSQVRFIVNALHDSYVLVYDYLNNAWSTFTYKNSAGVGLTFVNGCVIDNVVYMTASNLDLYFEDTGKCTDDASTFVSMRYRGPFVHSDSAVQDWQRVRRAGLLARYSTDVNATINLYFDYDDSVMETRTFVSDTWTSTTVRPMQVVPGRQKCQSVSVEFIDATPTGSLSSVGLGGGFVLQSMTLALQPKDNQARIPPALSQ